MGQCLCVTFSYTPVHLVESVLKLKPVHESGRMYEF